MGFGAAKGRVTTLWSRATSIMIRPFAVAWLLTVASALVVVALPIRAGDKAPPLAVAPFDAVKARQHQDSWAKHLNVPVETTNSVGMKLVLIPPGDFQMGSPNSDKDAEDGEKPQHRVRITKPFYLGKYEVTRGEFRKFVAATKYQTSADTNGRGGWGVTRDAQNLFTYGSEFTWRNASLEQTDEHPVVNVNWNDAVEFCRWLSIQEGKTYRLATEAEWEYGCRAGTTGRWNSGDNGQDLQGHANIADESLKAMIAKFPGGDEKQFDNVNWNDGAPLTSPVGKYKPNRFGLHDMHGNVYEWCNDRGDPARDYYASSPVDDPPGPLQGPWTGRVMRGGSYLSRLSGPSQTRSADRSWNGQNYLFVFIGFRVALVANGRSDSAKASTQATPLNSEPSLPNQKTSTPDFEELEPEIKNSIRMKLRLIRGGELLMGSPDSSKTVDADEKPQHRVRITKPFYLGDYEVTRSEFGKFVTATQYITDAEKDDLGGWGFKDDADKYTERSKKFTWQNTGFKQTGNHPVVNVSWNDAQAFCHWLSKKDGAIYRLPTEAEWEWACRAGINGRRWSSGDEEASLQGSANLADASLEKVLVRFGYVPWNDAASFTSIVGTYKANPFGLFDMHGNVREWCGDRYASTYYAKSAGDDPGGSETGAARVCRGGSWYYEAAKCTSSYRGANLPMERHIDLGFRVARDP